MAFVCDFYLNYRSHRHSSAIWLKKIIGNSRDSSTNTAVVQTFPYSFNRLLLNGQYDRSHTRKKKTYFAVIAIPLSWLVECGLNAIN